MNDSKNYKSLLTNEKPQVITAEQTKRNITRAKHWEINTQPAITKQEFKDQSDINTILQQYQHHPHLLIPTEPQLYGDFSQATDYQSALNSIMDAQQQFLDLPAKVREKFNNDPGQFLDFVHNEENLPELVKMGLATERPKPSKTLDDVVQSIEKMQYDYRDPVQTKPHTDEPRKSRAVIKKSEDS